MNTEENVSEPQNSTSETLRDELISLSSAKEIKYSEKYLKKASMPALEKIKHDYTQFELERVNNLLTETLIGKFSGLMTQLKMVEDNDELEDELSSNKLLFRDVKSLITKISPYIPMIGLLSGALIIVKHVWINRDEEINPSRPKESAAKVQNVSSTGSDGGGVDVDDTDNNRTVTP